ncbi:hypothetical protein ACMZ4W_00338 [Brevundimonas naejangsanensis]
MRRLRRTGDGQQLLLPARRLASQGPGADGDPARPRRTGAGRSQHRGGRGAGLERAEGDTHRGLGPAGQDARRRQSRRGRLHREPVERSGPVRRGEAPCGELPPADRDAADLQRRDAGRHRLSGDAGGLGSADASADPGQSPREEGRMRDRPARPAGRSGGPAADPRPAGPADWAGRGAGTHERGGAGRSLAGRRPAQARRRPAPAGPPQGHGGAGPGSPAGAQRRPLRRPRRPRPAGRPDLHPRRRDHRNRRPPTGGQRRTLAEARRRNGAAVQGRARGGDRGDRLPVAGDLRSERPEV